MLGLSRAFALGFWLISFLATAPSCKSSGARLNAAVVQPATASGGRCGVPLLRSVDLRTGSSYMQMGKDQGFQALSQKNMGDLSTRLGTLSQDEQWLQTTAASVPPFIVNWAPAAGINAILRDGSLKAAGCINPGYVTTCHVERAMYAADECVFASVGPAEGRSQYGEVQIRFKDGIDGAHWGSTTTGYTYTGHGAMPADLDEARAGFASGFIASSDWRSYLTLQLVDLVRKSPQKDTLIEQLKQIAATSDDLDRRIQWWKFVDKNRLGYLEAHYDLEVSLKEVTSIAVPLRMYAEVKALSDVDPEILQRIVVLGDKDAVLTPLGSLDDGAVVGGAGRDSRDQAPSGSPSNDGKGAPEAAVDAVKRR